MYLLIVTGMSGAGKTLALRSMEELGFYCVDNLPSPMLAEFVKMCESAVPPIEKAAVTIDSRESLLSHNSRSEGIGSPSTAAAQNFSTPSITCR